MQALNAVMARLGAPYLDDSHQEDNKNKSSTGGIIWQLWSAAFHYRYLFHGKSQAAVRVLDENEMMRLQDPLFSISDYLANISRKNFLSFTSTCKAYCENRFARLVRVAPHKIAGMFMRIIDYQRGVLETITRKTPSTTIKERVAVILEHFPEDAVYDTFSPELRVGESISDEVPVKKIRAKFPLLQFETYDDCPSFDSDSDSDSD